MISPKTVNEIYESVKIEEVVGDFVTLKRRGVNMLGLCPFHNEKTPSFTVSPAKNFYKCFGCGKGGNSVNFVMEHEHFTYPEALKYLAQKYRIAVEEKELTAEEVAEQQYSESLYIVNEFAQKYFENQLFETDRGKSIGLNYFKERGYREDIIRKFGLGFTSEKSNGFKQYAESKGYKKETLRKLGLISERGQDFFRNRVMFTIFNLSGKPVAFAGRILEKNVKAPKYLNSPETDIYTKSKTLYGMFHARQAIRKEDECILVEGYTDVLSLHQAGLENVVASSGTALTPGQLRLIKRFTPNLKILYDGDAAGIKAALRGLDLALEADLNVKIVMLPEGQDPDSYLHEVGASSFKEYAEERAKDFILFKTELLLEETKGDPIKKAGLIKDIVNSIAKIPDAIKRSLYLQECANLMQVEENILLAETNSAISKNIEQRRRQQQSSRKDVSAELASGKPQVEEKKAEAISDKVGGVKGIELQERDLARILVSFSDEVYDAETKSTVGEYLLNNIEELIESFENKRYGEIARLCLKQINKKKPVNPKFFINHPDQSLSALSIELLQSRYELSPGWEERGIFLTTQKLPDANFIKDSKNALLRFKFRKVVQMCDQNMGRIKDLGSKQDEKQMTTLLKVQKKLYEMRDNLAKELGIVVLR